MEDIRVKDTDAMSDKSLNKENAKKAIEKKRKSKIIKTVIIIFAVIAVLFVAVWRLGLFDKFSKNNMLKSEQLTTYTVSRRTITQTLTSSGTLEPNDSYTITPLVSGEILVDYFEEGDIVEEDQILYQIDSSNIESSIKRAENSLKNIQNSLDDAIEEREKLNIKTDVSGVIEKIYVEIGDEISAGTKIADIVDKDTMLIDVPFMAVDAAYFHEGQSATLTFPSYETANGTIKEIKGTTAVNDLGVITRIVTISVNNIGSITTSTIAYASVGDAVCTAPSTFYYNDEGQVISKISGTVENIYYTEGSKISKNSIIVSLSSSDIENKIESLELNLDDANSNLEDTLDNYENYRITSPISGTVISKNYKAGDTLGSGSASAGGTSMAVIYDMSAFKFTMNIDELDIDKIKLYQDVVVTSDARSGTKYYGVVTNISIQGSTSNGTTVYPVTVTIENVEDESRRKVDEDGTIHKYYKTGKTGTISTHSLESINGNIYTYSGGVKIEKTINENGTVIISKDNKIMKTKTDGTYTLGSDTYTFSNGMNSLTLESVDESTMLRPGMNIDAEILVQNVENVIAVPVSAVMRGYRVKVISRAEEKMIDDSKQSTGTKTENVKPQDAPKFDMEIPPESDSNFAPAFEIPQNEEYTPRNPENKGNMATGYGSVSADTKYEEVTVSVGVTDNNFIEITEGLNVGDVVILDQVNSIGITNNAQQAQGFAQMGSGMGGFSGAPMMGGAGGMGGMRPGGR